MSLRVRASAWALLGVGSIVLSACGTEGDGARDQLEPVQATSYVTIEPATTTTTIAAAHTTAPPPGGTSPTEQTYVIQAGDSVSRIASLHGITMEQLVTFNQWTDGINHNLLPGVEVRIPPGAKVPGTGSGTGTGTGSTGATTAASGGTTPPASEGEGEGCMHTIVANDNPTRVANKYDISVQVLEQANAGNPAYVNFIPGDELIIPAGANC